MQIFIRQATGKCVMLTVEPTDSVEKLKAMVCDEWGIPRRQQRLIYSGQQLQDGRTLSDYGIADSSSIEFVLRLLSCQSCPGHGHDVVEGEEGRFY
ncbi:ubiquitin-like [Culex quinquefasciatus]|uniref:ubiquitin-like n=1 Tax=Culex quinquefasciatus TaxID=7176 RepID=UPI0018E37E5A|nr:ubiquitin-like [Culex quinquefasciatus]